MQKRETATNAELTRYVTTLLAKIDELQDVVKNKSKGQYGQQRGKFLRQNPDTLDIWITEPRTVQKLEKVSHTYYEYVYKYDFICHIYLIML